MTNKQDNKNDCKKAIRKFCHDIGDIVGVLSGYSGIFNMIAENRVTVNDTYVTELIQRIKENQHVTETKFIDIINRMKSQSSEYGTIFVELSKQAQVNYENEYHAWYALIEDVETAFSTTEHIDPQLIQQLTHHADQLANFRLSMLEQSC